jgi:hypothetical protein
MVDRLRLDHYVSGERWVPVAVRDDAGAYVLASDYDALAAQLARTERQNADLTAVVILRGEMLAAAERERDVLRQTLWSRERDLEAKEVLITGLRAEQDAADIEATALVVAMAEKCGVPDNWEPLADVAGKITQISNMAAALRAELVASEQKRVDEYIAGELLRAERDALRAELQHIANAKPSEWEADVRGQFQQWAQNRARAALAERQP